MIVASRLCRPEYARFDGMGGMVRAGRWHELGNRVIYAADSEALAVLEILVHLSALAHFPEHVCRKAFIPECLVPDIRDFGSLPSDWNRREPAHARALGTRWLRNGSSAALKVPSVVIPRESNFLINPEHPQVSEIEFSHALPFDFDARLSSQFQ